MKNYWYLSLGLIFIAIACSNSQQTDSQNKLLAEHENTGNTIDSIHSEDNLTDTTQKKLQKELPKNLALSYAKSSAKSNNKFAEDLISHYIKSKSQKNKNIFFSPFSISSAVSMTGEGARGETQKQIQNVFHLSDIDSLRKYGVLGLYQSLNKPKSNYKLNTSNSLWIQQGEKLNADFLESSKDFYLANVELIDFSDPNQSSKTINAFVAKKTENKIKNLLSPNLITPLTRLILTNTIYFKADWKQEFEMNDTYDQDFTTSDGIVKSVKMMHQNGYFNYYENESFQALEMEYKNNEMSMIVILPQTDEVGSIAGINLDQALNISADKYKRQEVVVSFPRFKFETSYSLKEDLSKMGMPLAFEKADFSGISKTMELKIAEVIHKAFIEVAEKGTEAAAATAVIMATESAAPRDEYRPKVFQADHPFIFVIRHNETGAILFMGVVNNPAKSN